jgi:transposase-like protein
VSYKHIKEFMADLKKICTAATEEAAFAQLSVFADKRQKEYPAAVKSWEENWDI